MVTERIAPRASIYWSDLLVSAGVGWGALGAGAVAGDHRIAIGAFVIAALALYRASAFIHEIGHAPHGTMRAFTIVWNALVGIPLLVPSYLYRGVHRDHHDVTRFGTPADPEYVPLRRRPYLRIGALLAAAMALPLLLVARWSLVTAIAFTHSRARAVVDRRLSAMALNPAYRRRSPSRDERVTWRALEAMTTAWAACLIVLFAHAKARHVVLALACVMSAIAVLNLLRTLASHDFTVDRASSTFDGQVLASKNVVGRPILTELWAPLGLRHHALHHLFPAIPYHALGEVQRLLQAALGESALYRRVTFDSWWAALTSENRRGPSRVRRPS